MDELYRKMLQQLKTEMSSCIEDKKHPFLTLSFAQSLDGCLSLKAGQSTALSGLDSLKMTHQLRTLHHAILVGIDTVLSDDPRLTARYADGPDPRPIILDSRLRIPLDCQLIQNSAPRLIIFAGEEADPQKKAELEKRGVEIYRLPPHINGGLCLRQLVATLKQQGIESVMIEGGGRIISSFLAQRLIDFIIVTIAPVVLGSRDAIRYETYGSSCIAEPQVFHLGQDMIAWGHQTRPRRHQYKQVGIIADGSAS
ncbi:MAG: RibD family protein [Oligoflexus sp.]